MAKLTRGPREIIAYDDEPVYMIRGVDENGLTITRIVVGDNRTDDDEDEGQNALLALKGIWSDLDWERMEEELYQIRHSNPPTPPIDDL